MTTIKKAIQATNKGLTVGAAEMKWQSRLSS